MFQNCEDFNQPLNNWNVSNVEDMEYMFQNARSFNQPLNNWNVSKVETMFAMFDAPSARFRLLLLKPAQHELLAQKKVKCSRGTLQIAVPAFHCRASAARGA